MQLLQSQHLQVNLVIRDPEPHLVLLRFGFILEKVDIAQLKWIGIQKKGWDILKIGRN